MRVLKFVGCKHCVGPAHLLVKTHSWACLLKPTKSALWFNAKLSMHGKVWLLLMRSDAKLPKSACHSLGNDLGVWDTLKLKRRKGRKQRPFGPEWRAEAREPFDHCERNTSESFSLRRCSPCEEIERNTVKVWESEKRKMRYFSLFKLHIRR